MNPVSRVTNIPDLATPWVDRAERIPWPSITPGTRQLTQVTVLSGSSGAGKSQLAAEYAHQRAADGWPVILWLTAADEASLLDGLDRAAETLGAWAATSDVSRTVPAALAQLRRHPGPVLMVYDDAADLALVHRWMPRFGAVHVVVTTQATVPGAVEVGGHVPPGLEDLAARLDHHPAALAVAASTIGPGRRFPAPDDHPGTDVVRLAHEVLPADLYWLLECLAVMAPTGTSPQLLDQREPLDVPSALATVVDGRITLASYVRRMIADRIRETGRLDMVLTHVTDMLGKAMRRSRTPSRSAALEIALHLHAVYLHSTRADHKLRKRLMRLRSESTDLLLRSHNTSAVEILGPPILLDATVLHGNVAHGDLVLTLANLKRARDALGYPADSLLGRQSLVAAAVRVLGPLHPETLAHRNILGVVLRRFGNIEDATAVHAAVLDDCRAALGADHPETLEAGFQLGRDYRDLGRLDEAAVLHERTYADRRRVLGPGHVETAYSGGAVAVCLLEHRYLDEGIRMLEQVFADHMATGAPTREVVTNLEHNLADAYRMAGRTADATAMYRRCLASYDRDQRGSVAALTAQGEFAALTAELAGRSGPA